MNNCNEGQYQNVISWNGFSEIFVSVYIYPQIKLVSIVAPVNLWNLVDIDDPVISSFHGI